MQDFEIKILDIHSIIHIILIFDFPNLERLTPVQKCCVRNGLPNHCLSYCKQSEESLVSRSSDNVCLGKIDVIAKCQNAQEPAKQCKIIIHLIKLDILMSIPPSANSFLFLFLRFPERKMLSRSGSTNSMFGRLSAKLNCNSIPKPRRFNMCKSYQQDYALSSK